VRSSPVLVVAGCVALALVATSAAIAARRQQARELSPLPTVENGGPRGLAAARAWLEATGRPQRVLRGGDLPRVEEVVLLVAPPAPVAEADVALLVRHVEAGGLLVWALGDAPQPALARELGVERVERATGSPHRATQPLAPHPIFDGLRLRTGGAALHATTGAGHPVEGERDRAAALVVARGAGEAIVLADPAVLENLGLAEGENLALLSRLATRGPLAFDERHLAHAVPPSLRPRRPAIALAAQVLLAVAVLLVGLGRRLGAIRAAPTLPGGPTARDYLASLGGLYRRAGAERELAEESFRRLRRRLERRDGVPVGVSDDEAARRLSQRDPAAAAALRRAAEGRDAGSLLAVARAAAMLDAPPRPGGREGAL